MAQQLATNVSVFNNCRISVDSMGRLYVPDLNAGKIRRYQSDLAAYEEMSLSTAYSAGSLDADRLGNVYVKNMDSCQIVEFDTLNNPYTNWMSCGYGIGFGTSFGDVAVDNSNPAKVYVVDWNQGRVQSFKHNSATPTTMDFVTMWDLSVSNIHFGIMTDAAGLVYIAAGSQILVYQVSGTTASLVSGSPWDASAVGGADDIAFDGHGHLFTTSTSTRTIAIWNLSGQVLCTGIGSGILTAPDGIAVGPSGEILVSDSNGANVHKFVGCP
jgi:WD40 repeat protein